MLVILLRQVIGSVRDSVYPNTALEKMTPRSETHMTTEKNNQQGDLRTSLLADITEAEQKIEAFNNHILNHKHMYPGIAAAILIMLYLGMVEPHIQMHIWGMIGTLFIILGGATWWKRREADKLNAALEAAELAFKEYEKGRRKKRRKKK